MKTIFSTAKRGLKQLFDYDSRLHVRMTYQGLLQTQLGIQELVQLNKHNLNSRFVRRPNSHGLIVTAIFMT